MCIWYDAGCVLVKQSLVLIVEALKAVIGVGKAGKPFKITPSRIILFAILVALLFLGAISGLLFLTSLLISV